MKRILVAGGAGYVGCVLVPKLIENGHDVTVVDKLWFGNNLANTAATVVERDVFDLDEQDLQQFDTVVFLAGLSNDPMADFDPRANFIQNGAAPAYLAYMSKKAGVERFIHGGSCSVYGNAPGQIMDEHKDRNSDFPYGISKINGEDAAFQMRDESFSVICVRKGTVCGHSPRMRFDLIINRMCRDALTNGTITVNNPKIWRPILGVNDAARAYCLAVEASIDVSGVFNFLSENYTVGAIGTAVKAIIEEVSGGTIDLQINSIPDKRDYRVNGYLARKMLGFHGADSIHSIVSDILANWKSYGDVYSDKYSNIDTFKALEAPSHAAA